MSYDIICIGHLTKDRIVTPKTERYMYGGTSLYFSYGISRLLDGRLNYRLVTSLAQEDMEAVEQMRAEGIEVQVIQSRHTVFFENIYGEDTDNRRQRVREKADPFCAADLGDMTARYVVLGSLLPDDFSIDLIGQLSAQGCTLVLDAQGYLRQMAEDGEVAATDWQEKREVLKYIDILKVNEHEAFVLSGKKNVREAALQLARWGVKEVLLTMGSAGSIILSHGRLHVIPAYTPKQVTDATGCGDTFVMGYVYQRALGADIDSAGRFAAAASAIKLESFGPLRRTKEEIEEFMKQTNPEANSTSLC